MSTTRARRFTIALAGCVASGVVAWSAAIDPARAGAAYPGTNGKIAFSSDRDVPSGEIYSIVPGGNADRLTFSFGSSDPVYSPDGTRIAFVSEDQIFVMNANGSERTQVTTSPTPKQSPTWSPDGTKIAYVANSFDVDGQTDDEIWAINVDGTGRTQLTDNNDVVDREPAWSPLGDKIAFVGQRPGDTDRNVYVLNADVSGEANITPNVLTDCSPPPTPETCYQGHDDSPAWSPDGSKIGYVHSQEPNASGAVRAIWTMDPNGAFKANLTNNPDVSYAQPAWSPAGDMLAAVGTATGTTTGSDIWAMNSNGSAQAPVETNPADDINPDWQPLLPPECQDVTESTGAGEGVAVVLDCSGAGLTYEIVAGPENGDTSNLDPAAGTLTYTPEASFSGEDTFTFRATNGAGNSNEATATIFVAPPNDFTFGPVTKNRMRGTAKLTVRLPDAGVLALRGKGIEPVDKGVAGPGDATLKVRPKGRKLRKLTESGKARVRPKVTYTPAGGAANTEVTKIKLVDR